VKSRFARVAPRQGEHRAFNGCFASAAQNESSLGPVIQAHDRVPTLQTEHASPRYSGIDRWEPPDVLDALIEGQFAAVAAVRAARPALERQHLRPRHASRSAVASSMSVPARQGVSPVQDGAEAHPDLQLA